MHTVLVTGATGAAGDYVIPALQSRGFRVRGQYHRKPGTIQGVEWRRMNFLESLDFHPLLERCMHSRVAVAIRDIHVASGRDGDVGRPMKRPGSLLDRI